MTDNVYDAMGNPIKIGQRYGYARNNNGHIIIVHGTAKKINTENHKVSLENVFEKSGIYGTVNEEFKPVKNRSVFGVMCFPVVPEELLKLMMLGDEKK